MQIGDEISQGHQHYQYGHDQKTNRLQIILLVNLVKWLQTKESRQEFIFLKDFHFVSNFLLHVRLSGFPAND